MSGKITEEFDDQKPLHGGPKLQQQPFIFNNHQLQHLTSIPIHYHLCINSHPPNSPTGISSSTFQVLSASIQHPNLSINISFHISIVRLRSRLSISQAFLNKFPLWPLSEIRHVLRRSNLILCRTYVIVSLYLWPVFIASRSASLLKNFSYME